MLPFTSLDAATSPVAGTARDLEGVFLRHTLVYTVTGTIPLGYRVDLQGSHDGENWDTLASASASNTGPDTGMLASDSRLVRYVRAELVEKSGGFGAVTATIASA